MIIEEKVNLFMILVCWCSSLRSDWLDSQWAWNVFKMPHLDNKEFSVSFDAVAETRVDNLPLH
jgi:hypothetical protein